MIYLLSNTQSLYWLTRLDAIKGVLGLIGYGSIIAIAVIYTVCLMSADFDYYKSAEEVKERKDVRKSAKSKVKYLIIISILTLMLKVFVPSREEVIFIVAGGKTLDFVQSDSSLNKIPAQSTKLITDYLESQIKDVKGK